VQLWYIEWELGAEPDLRDCRALACRERHGRGVAVLLCDGAAIERIRRSPGLRVVRLPRDGETFTDRRGRTFVVEADGQVWREV